jgi:hypothetical protein
MDVWAGQGDDNDERIPLCRIEYLGEDDDWAFALYDPATQTYTDAARRMDPIAASCAPAAPRLAVVRLPRRQAG